jgi:hypothetical protein
VSDAASPERVFVVGGDGRLGWAVPMDQVRRIVRAPDLPPRYRSASLPRVFDRPPASADEARYAEVLGGAADTFLDLGGHARVVAVRDGDVEALPQILSTVAARWGWTALVRDGDARRVLVDVPLLASLAAPRVRT